MPGGLRVISGDHLTMDSDFCENIDPDYTRTVYNVIINSPIQPQQEKNRSFTTMDMFPTTLASLGATIEGDPAWCTPKRSSPMTAAPWSERSISITAVCISTLSAAYGCVIHPPSRT